MSGASALVFKRTDGYRDSAAIVNVTACFVLAQALAFSVYVQITASVITGIETYSMWSRVLLWRP